MIGQTGLLSKLNAIPSIDKLARVNLVIGPEGSGRHTFIKEVAKKFNVEATPFTLSEIDSLYDETTISLRYIDLGEIALKEQLQLATVTKKVPQLVWIFIIGENPNLIEDALFNRCFIWQMDAYTVDELSIFVPMGVNAVRAIKVANTPGQISKIRSADELNALFELCDTIIGKMSLANFANALTLVNKVDRDKPDKFDPILFLNCMLYRLYGKGLTSLYLLTLNYRKMLNYKKLVLSNLLSSYIVSLWKEYHNGCSRT